MKKTFINKAHIEGWLYSHELQMKETGPNSKNPGTEYITGIINIATDNDMTNVIPVHFTYVTAVTSKGNTNATFNTLKDIIDGNLATVAAKGQDGAVKFRIDTSIALNEFYTDRNGETELVVAKRYEGGFVHVTPTIDEDEKKRNTFDTDILITNVIEKEADEERGLTAKVLIKGYIFEDYRKAILPVEFETDIPGAMDYFLGLGATDKAPVFTRVKGKQVSMTIIQKKEEPSAFGEPSIIEVKRNRKAFYVNWAQGDEYELGGEDTLTGEELTKMMSEREIHLADIKKRNDEYLASKKAPAVGGFDF